MKSKVWLILPAYNEGELIEKSVNLLDDVLNRLIENGKLSADSRILFVDDGSDDEICSYDVIDIIKTEQKVKDNGCDRHYVQGDKPKTERKPRERKVDNEKLFLLQGLASGLENKIGLDVTYENEVKLHFNYNGSSYSVTLTKHRPPKK